MGGCILYCCGDMKLGVGGRSPLCAIGHGTCPSVTIQNTQYKAIGEHCFPQHSKHRQGNQKALQLCDSYQNTIKAHPCRHGTTMTRMTGIVA